MNRRLSWLAVPAAILTALLYPSFFANSVTPPSDAEAVAAARTILSKLGIDPAPFKFSIRRSFDEDQYRRLEGAGADRFAALVSPLEIEVGATAPGSAMKLVLSERLTPVEWSTSKPGPANAVSDETWLALFGGSQAGCFAETSNRTRAREKRERRWTCRDEATGREAHFTIVFQNQAPREAHLRVSSAPGHPGVVLDGLQDAVSIAGILTMVVLAPAAFVYAVTRRKRHRDHLKSAVKFALLFIVLCLALWAMGMLPRMDGGEEGSAQWLGRPLALILTLAPGFALVTGWQARSWLAMQVAVQRQAPARILGRQLLSGFALGQILALVVTLCASAGFLWGALPGLIPLDHLFDRFQFTTAISQTPSRSIMALFFFGVLLPWAVRETPAPRRKGLVAVCGVALTTLGLHLVRGNGLAAILAAAAATGVLAWGYRYLGMLAVLSALPSAVVAPALALAAARRDSAGVAAEAVPALAAIGLCLLVARFGRAADLDSVSEELARRNAPERDDIRPERERLLTEVALAREAQRSLLPSNPPVLPGVSVAAACIPAGEVGGDLYDYLSFASGRTAFCVADVSGKGVTASVYNSYAKGMLAALARRNASLETLAAELNGHFLETARRKTFFTLVVALLDPKLRTLRLLRMGHNPPLLQRASGDAEWLRPPGLGVGLGSNKSLMRVLQIQTVQLEPGDTLVLYSDGLTEAMNPDQELYGEDRLRETVAKNAGMDAAALNEVLLRDVDLFRKGAEPNDDLTLLTLRISEDPWRENTVPNAAAKM